MPQLRYSLAFLSVAAVVSSGCQREGRASARATVRDSAGIVIVESATPLGGEHLPWTLDTIPTIDLGREDDPHEQFSDLVIPLRLGNGQIVVATGGTSELRFFDKSGNWLRSVGRSGQGPGEFESLGWLGLSPGDSLKTYDWSLRRLSVFSPTGEFVRSCLLASPGPARGSVPRASLPGGAVLVSTTPFVMPGAASGVIRDTAPLLIYGETGAPIDSFGDFPGSEALIEGTERSVTVMRYPFGKALVVAVSERHDAIYLGSEERPEVSQWTTDGRLLRIVRWQAPAIPVTDKDKEAYLQELKESAGTAQGGPESGVVQMLRKASLPAHKPAYAGVVSGARGTLWVQTYTEPDRTRPVPYQVFDSTGQWLGELILPPRFTATQIGEDFMLGVWKDEDDVEHVRSYRLVARGPG